MKILKSLSLGIFGLILSFNINAEDVSRGHVEQMLNSMVAQGIIPASEAESAREKLKTISPEEWSKINLQAQLMAEKYQAQNPQVDLSAKSAANNIDFDGEMFKEVQKEIQNQMTLSRLPAQDE